MYNLKGKRYIVAGASSETGMAIVSQLLDSGASVIALEDKVKLQTAGESGSMKDFPLDIHSLELYNAGTLEAELKSLLKSDEMLDGLIFAGGRGGVRPLQLTKPAFVQEMLNDNLVVFIELVRCLSKKNIMTNGSSIVAVSSVSSLKGLKSKTAYCAAKAGLDAAIRCMAQELGDRKIRVNSILKGWVSSDMKLDFIQNNMELSKNEDFQKQFLGVIEPEQIAGLVCFLISDVARSITGTSIPLDGGYLV